MTDSDHDFDAEEYLPSSSAANQLNMVTQIVIKDCPHQITMSPSPKKANLVFPLLAKIMQPIIYFYSKDFLRPTNKIILKVDRRCHLVLMSNQ